MCSAAAPQPFVCARVQVRDIAAADGGRLMLVFNPQWQTDGQIVSDFGCACHCLARIPEPVAAAKLPSTQHPGSRFGQSRREAEDFVGSFVDVSVTQRVRVLGDDVRLFRCYPGSWQVCSCWRSQALFWHLWQPVQQCSRPAVPCRFAACVLKGSWDLQTCAGALHLAQWARRAAGGRGAAAAQLRAAAGAAALRPRLQGQPPLGRPHQPLHAGALLCLMLLT